MRNAFNMIDVYIKNDKFKYSRMTLTRNTHANTSVSCFEFYLVSIISWLLQDLFDKLLFILSLSAMQRPLCQ